MKFYLQVHSVKNGRRLGDVSVLNPSAYEPLNIYIKRVYQGLCRRRAPCTQKKVMLTETQREGQNTQCVRK